jgi:hypothetical protein
MAMPANVEFVVLLDGFEWRVFDDEKDAQDAVRLYDGEHDIWYEKRDVET